MPVPAAGARACRVDPVEALDDTVEVFGCDSLAVVGDRDLELDALSRALRAQPGRLLSGPQRDCILVPVYTACAASPLIAPTATARRPPPSKPPRVSCPRFPEASSSSPKTRRYPLSIEPDAQPIASHTTPLRPGSMAAREPPLPASGPGRRGACPGPRPGVLDMRKLAKASSGPEPDRREGSATSEPEGALEAQPGAR
jgi:hypothetical protein